MFRLNNKTRKYQTPSVKVTHMALEKDFCTATMRLNMQVDELDNINIRGKAYGADTPEEQLYFEF